MKRYISALAVTLSVSVLFLFSANPAAASLKNFKKDFAEQTEAQSSDETSGAQKADKKASGEQRTARPVIVAQAEETPAAPPSRLRNFYDDFNPPPAAPDTETPASGGGNTYNYYSGYTPGYYQYNYPYYYPYSSYYPDENVIIYEDDYSAARPRVKALQPAVPDRHTWYSASMDSRYISRDLSSVGIETSIVSAGKAAELSYGMKLDYKLFTEKDGDEHFSLPLSNIGIVLGKQMGAGLMEAFIAYATLDNVSGLSLELSTDQWARKHFFISGSVGVSIINSSPMTSLYAGIGVGSAAIKCSLGYQVQTSVNNNLNGPEFRLGVVF